MTKSSFFWASSGFLALFLLVAIGGCAPSTSSNTPKSQGAATAAQAQTLPPSVNIGNEQAMSQAAKESAERFGKKK